MSPLDAILRTNPEYVEALHRQYQRDPASVDVGWAAFFAGWEMGLAEAPRAAAPTSAGSSTAPREAPPARPLRVVEPLPTDAQGLPIILTETGGLPDGVDKSAVEAGLRIYDVVHAYRAYGHLVADLDPLGRSERTHPLLALSEFGFTEADLDQVVRCASFKGLTEGTVREYIAALRETYSGPIGVECMDIGDKAQRDWMQEQMEPVRNRAPLDSQRRHAILEQLIVADTFEETLGRMYPGAKRFSLEGATTLVTLLHTLVEDAAEAGVEQVVMGMAHRGRLNVLGNVLGKPYEYILAEFEGRPLPPEVSGYGDVKYHLGYSRRHRTSTGRDVDLDVEFNPSHLEAVDPVVQGIVRARQNHLGDAERRRVIPVLMHGDAAFAGQGVVAETFLLAGLKAYNTGGTIHVIVNNQVGFTTDPDEGRATRYASDIAKIARAPVFHVNGDHPEAVRHVARIALAYRQEFRRDVVIDLVCYRRHGHNELDDPTFTQPVMYGLIESHPTNSKVYADKLLMDGIVSADEVEAMKAGVAARLDAAHEKAKGMSSIYLGKLGGIWEGLRPAGDDWSADTAVPRATLESIATAMITTPEGFHWHPRLRKLMQQRADMVLKGQPLDWGCAEMLAIGSLLLEGTKVRLTGQDTGRGTFSHRHAVYTDIESGERYVPLNHIADGQNVFQVVNSPLSEEAVLGFEYGYSTADPWTLVAWEAQFGDFVNGAQVIIDQLIASCEYKWGRMSGLVLLLPHGYEGQGPEHSSARLERFLELCAENNMQVCHFTTPAQYFHALRRQMHRSFRKPLIVMTPKSLLRHKLAVSALSELTDGSFKPLLDDAEVTDRRAITRLLICSGKVYYGLYQSRAERLARGEGRETAVARLEQMYPFPEADLLALLAEYPKLTSLVWVQEEPQNMGAWRHLRHRFEKCLPPGVTLEYAGRHSAAVPATGSFEVHVREEKALIEAAFTPVGAAVPPPAVVTPVLAPVAAAAMPAPSSPLPKQAADATAETFRKRVGRK